MSLLCQFARKYPIVGSFLLTLVVSLSGNAQDRITTIEMSEPRNQKIALTTKEAAALMGIADKPYLLYGTDFRGVGGFYISFNLETRQTVQYQLVDMMGRQIAWQNLRDVLDETYRVQANSLASGTYIVRLMIDRKCYSERVFFMP